MVAKTRKNEHRSEDGRINVRFFILGNQIFSGPLAGNGLLMIRWGPVFLLGRLLQIAVCAKPITDADIIE
jgi:hypothetical protein